MKGKDEKFLRLTGSSHRRNGLCPGHLVRGFDPYVPFDLGLQCPRVLLGSCVSGVTSNVSSPFTDSICVLYLIHDYGPCLSYFSVLISVLSFVLVTLGTEVKVSI